MVQYVTVLFPTQKHTPLPRFSDDSVPTSYASMVAKMPLSLVPGPRLPGDSALEAELVWLAVGLLCAVAAGPASPPSSSSSSSWYRDCLAERRRSWNGDRALLCSLLSG